VSSLRVEPAALDSYGAQVDRARDDTRLISEYILKYATDGVGGELIGIANEGNDRAVVVLDGTFLRLESLLEYSSPELRAAAAYYRSTALEAAISIDSALPEGIRRCPTVVEYEIANNPCKAPLFGDSRAPSLRLQPPVGEPDTPVNKLGFMDYISPTAWMMKGFDIILGFDPIQEVQNKIFGDWEVYAHMEPVLNNAAVAVHDLAINVQSGASSLPEHWQGNAGDAAFRYFTDLAESIENLRVPLVEMAKEYRTMANAVWEAGDAIGGLLKGMCDAAIIAGIAAAGGTATAATGLGAAVGYGLAAGEAAYILTQWALITKYLQYANAAVMGFRAGLDRGLSSLESIAFPSIGGGPGYDHPLTGMGAHV
jgi:uncharacterized protein YukE